MNEKLPDPATLIGGDCSHVSCGVATSGPSQRWSVPDTAMRCQFESLATTPVELPVVHALCAVSTVSVADWLALSSALMMTVTERSTGRAICSVGSSTLIVTVAVSTVVAAETWTGIVIVVCWPGAVAGMLMFGPLGNTRCGFDDDTAAMIDDSVVAPVLRMVSERVPTSPLST